MSISSPFWLRRDFQRRLHISSANAVRFAAAGSRQRQQVLLFMLLLTSAYLDALCITPLSHHESPGYGYAFDHLDTRSPSTIAANQRFLKFGRSSNVCRRQGEWDRQCHPHRHNWLWAYETATPRRLGECFVFFKYGFGAHRARRATRPWNAHPQRVSPSAPRMRWLPASTQGEFQGDGG